MKKYFKARGLKENYDPQNKHKGIFYFAEDTGQLLLDGVSYSEATDLTPYAKAINLPDSVISNADISSDANNVTLKYTRDSLIDGSNSEVNLQIPAATTSAAGVMSAPDKVKLDSLVKYQAGNGIDITGDTISCTLDTSLYSIVTELPETGLPNKIYLLPSTETEEGNIYTEYGYVDNKWEKLGEFKADVNLEPYAKALNLPNRIAGFDGAGSFMYMDRRPNEVILVLKLHNLINNVTTDEGVFILGASQHNAGVMSASDKNKLDGIEAGAKANKIESVSVNGTPLEITNKGVNIPIHEYTAGGGINISEGVISTTPISIKTEKFSFVNSGSHQPTYNYSGVTIYDDRYISGTKYGIAFDEADIKPRTTITSPDGVRTVCFALDQSVRRKIETAITSISVNNIGQVNTNGAVNLTIPNASITENGLMSKEDKAKLDSQPTIKASNATGVTDDDYVVIKKSEYQSILDRLSALEGS